MTVGTDEDLVSRARTGESLAFEELARRHYGWLVRTCRPILGGDHHHAEDVAQECLVRLHATLVRDTRPLAVRPWLSVVARNLCIDHVRRRTPEPVDEVPDTAATDDDPYDVDPVLAQAWAKLNRRQREVLQHRELTGLSYDEIATVMGTSVSAVETLLFRARAALRREYTRAGGRFLGCGAFLFGFERMSRGHGAVPHVVAHVARCSQCSDALGDIDLLSDLLRLGSSSVRATAAPQPRSQGMWFSRVMDHLAGHAVHVGAMAEPIASVAAAAALALAPVAVAPQAASAPPSRGAVVEPHTVPVVRPAAAGVARAAAGTVVSPAPTPTVDRAGSSWPGQQAPSPGSRPTWSPRPIWSPGVPWPTPSPLAPAPWPTPSRW